jgi:hypothetical protein
MASTLAGTFLILLLIVQYNAYREGGTYAVRSWWKAKFLNDPAPRPGARRPARRVVTSPRGIRSRQSWGSGTGGIQ